MTVSLLWLSDYLQTNLTPEQIAEALTSIGLEVEKIEKRDSIMGGLSGIIAGKVLTCEKHPDADRLSVTTVDVGKDQPANIVCGANNIAAGQMVWVALPETTLYDKTGNPWTIKSTRIRGAVSEGMICAEDELGLGDDHDGIMILPDAVKVGTRASDFYKVTSDTIFEIGLTPNRSDATSMLGVAEDLAAYLNIQSGSSIKVNWPDVHDMPEKTSFPSYAVEVMNYEACPRYSGIVISNLMIGPSPEWMQKRLQSIGVKTINNIVDITNFVLHEMGQPLHAFDAEKINGSKVIVETKPAGTPFLALDGESYTLYQEDLMICDGNGNPMCIAGVYGGLNSGVTASTKTIFLESAHFNAGWVRRTSMRHNLRTEAARRFEKGSDPNITLKALFRACDLISQIAGGTIVSQVVDVYPQPILPARVTLRPSRLNAITGIHFQEERVLKILNALKMEIVSKDPDRIVVEVPTNKADVLREIDVIEEILRIYGFSKVPHPGKMQTSVVVESRHALHRMRRLVGQFLAARGFLEAMNMSLTHPSYYKLDGSAGRKEWISIHNTSNESLNLLRPEMIAPTLETVARNLNRRQEDIRMFEFGNTYRQENGVPTETEHLVLTLTGKRQADHWHGGSGVMIDFFLLKSESEALLQRLGVEDFHAKPFESRSPFGYGLQYMIGGTELGSIGSVSDEWLDAFNISQPVFIADFSFEAVTALSNRSGTIYAELNRFPSVERDLAIVVEEHIPYDEVQRIALAAGGSWLTQLELFDVYANPEHLGPGKKSMALRFTIENKEATLTDRDIDGWFSKMQKAFVTELKAEIRK